MPRRLTRSFGQVANAFDTPDGGAALDLCVYPDAETLNMMKLARMMMTMLGKPATLFLFPLKELPMPGNKISITIDHLL